MSEEYEVIKNLGLLVDDVYKNEFFSVGVEFDGYKVLATSPSSQHGFQALLLENVDPDVEGSRYVIAFRGTEGNPFFTIECLRDLLETDAFQMGTGNIAVQFIEAIMFVKKMADQYGLNCTNTTFTGHSLGGALATVATYVFGFESYTYNAFGIEKNDLYSTGATIGDIFSSFIDNFPKNGMEDPLTHVASNLGIDPSVLAEFADSTQTVAGNMTDVTNYVCVGKNDEQEFVSGILSDLVGGLIGDVVPVMNQESGALFAHFIAPLNQSIAVYTDLLTIFPEADYNTLTEALCYVHGTTPVMELLLDMADLFKLGDRNSLKTLSAPVLSKMLADAGHAGLKLTSLSGFSASSLATIAKLDGNMGLACRYALAHLDSFMLVGADLLIQGHNLQGELSLYDSSTGVGLTQEYLEDRAKMLAVLLDINKDDLQRQDNPDNGLKAYFKDFASGDGRHFIVGEDVEVKFAADVMHIWQQAA